MIGPSEILILIQRGLFGISFGICLSSLWLVMKFIHSAGPFVFKGLGTKRDRENICIRLATAGFRYLMLAPCSPWIRLFGEKQLDETFRAAAADGTPFVIANHNSMVDSLLVTALIPQSIACKMRSLIKLGLFKLPVFGGICTSVGHFPVFFKGSKDGDFSVDREAQAKVTEDMDRFLFGDGGLLLFPEGQLNVKPRQLQPFRRGAFVMPMKHRKPIWGFLNVGCEKMWPKGQQIGGIPADIFVKMFKICDNAADFEDNTALATHAQEIMQKNLDEMYAAIDVLTSEKKAQ